MAGFTTSREDPMKALAILIFMLGISVTPVYAQQPGTVTFNGNIFEAPSSQGAGYAQGPGSYTQPAKQRTYQHVKRHHYKHSAS
jgi:hypothetical protein